MTIKIPQQITLPRALVVLLAILGMLVLSADSCSSSNSQESTQVSSQQDIYNRHQPAPLYQYSNERAALVQILNQRTSGNLNTWTVWYSNDGKPLGMCPSKGYPIPYSTELTNPLQATNGPSGGGETSVGQMDPQGTYPSSSTLATWVLCIEGSSGSIHPLYIEPLVITYTYPVEIHNGQVVQTGAATTESGVTLKDKS